MYKKIKWTRFLPESLRQKIENWPELQKIIENINWLFLDKAIQITIAIGVGAFVIRYLGPERYGDLSYSVAFASLFTVFAGLNIGEIAVREIIENKYTKEDVMGTIFAIRFIGGIVATILTIISIYFINNDNLLIVTLVALISLQNLFIPFTAIQNWFASKVEAKHNVISRNLASIIGGILRIIFIFLQLPLIYFALAIVIETAFSYIIIAVPYKLSGEKIKKWRFNPSVAKLMAKSGWPLFLASIFNTIYKRVDQVIVKNMLDSTTLGNYAAAVKISDNINFISVAISGSVFPAIIYSKKQSRELFYSRVQKLFDVMLWISILIAVVFTLIAKPLVSFLFGNQYTTSAPLLSIHIWGTIFIFLLSAARRVLIIEDLTKINLISSFAGGVSIVLLNILLIPKFGIFGAAYTVVLASFISFFVLIFFKNSRVNILMAIKSLNIVRIYNYIYDFLIRK